jgi:hypothetical protein
LETAENLAVMQRFMADLRLNGERRCIVINLRQDAADSPK